MARRKKKSAPRPETWRDRPEIWALAIGLAAFLLYLPSLWSGFVYDAEAQILSDGYIHDHSHFWEVITFQVMGRDVLDFNRPVQLFFLMMDSLLWGKNPFGYHLTTNLMHAANAALLFLLLLRLEAGRVPAALAALLFAAHPMLVEPVAEVSSREDVVAVLFILLALLLAIRRSYWCVLAVVLACGAKETGAAAPFLIGLYWLGYRRKEPIRAWAGLLAACFAAAGLFFAARFSLQVKDSQIFLHPAAPLANTMTGIFPIQMRIWTYLIRAIFWPVELSADYTAQNVLWISQALAIGTMVAFVAAQAWLAWKSRLGLLGAATFWLGLAPVSNFMPLFRPMADRFMYLPMAGFAMMVCALLLLARSRGLNLLVAAGIFVLAVLAWQRQAVFANPLNLWRDTLAKSPFSHTAANNLGYALLQKKDYAGAEEAFTQALRLTQDHHADALAGLAIACEYQGRPAEAARMLEKAVEVEPIYAEPGRLVTAMMATPENAAILEKIRRRHAP